MMTHDLRQKELGVERWRRQEVDLALRIRMRIRPAAERDRVVTLAEQPPQFPRVLDDARHADRFVAAKNDERRKSALVRAVRVRRHVFERVLRGDEWHDALARDIEPEVRHEMPKVVLS